MVSRKSRGNGGKKVEEMYELIKGIEIAMLTTRRSDGRLVSRPMATQKMIPGADLTREWVSVSGTAQVSTDRAEIRTLWAPDWKAWFPDDGLGRDGGPDDPRLALIKVDADSVVYMISNKPQPVVLFELVKARSPGSTPDIGEVRKVSGKEL